MTGAFNLPLNCAKTLSEAAPHDMGNYFVFEAAITTFHTTRQPNSQY
jgi:hypothetical protein